MIEQGNMSYDNTIKSIEFSLAMLYRSVGFIWILLYEITFNIINKHGIQDPLTIF